MASKDSCGFGNISFLPLFAEFVENCNVKRVTRVPPPSHHVRKRVPKRLQNESKMLPKPIKIYLGTLRVIFQNINILIVKLCFLRYRPPQGRQKNVLKTLQKPYRTSILFVIDFRSKKVPKLLKHGANIDSKNRP